MVPQLVPHEESNQLNPNVFYPMYKPQSNSSPFYELNENHSELCSKYYWDIYDVQKNGLQNANDTVLDEIQDFFRLLLQGNLYNKIMFLWFIL